MPRNGSGTYTLPAGNPVEAGTLIEATWANNTLNDLANEMTDSLSRSGEGGMLAPFRLADGLQATPGIAWLNEPSTGFYRAGSQEMWGVVGGTQVLQFTSNGVAGRFAAGAVGTPSITRAGDLNTGIYFPGADELGLTTAGVLRLSIDAAGGVAIPGMLTLNGSIAGTFTVGVGNGGTGATTASAARVSLLPSYSTNALKVLRVNAGATDVEWTTANAGDVVGPSSSTDNAIARYDGTTGKLIQDSGVSIDDSSNVALTDAKQVLWGAGTAAIQGSSAANSFGIYTSSLERVSVSSSGGVTVTPATGGTAVFNEGGVDADLRIEGDTDVNLLFVDASTDRVGIGTSSPASKFEVNGALTVAAGTNSAPSVTPTGDTNTGIYFSAADAVNFSEGGTGYRIGFRNIPAVGTKTGSYTLDVADVGKYVQVGSGGSITVPNSTFAEGDVISIFNNTTGSVTLTMSITTAYIAGTDADKNSLTLATRGVATILFISGTVCVVSGNVS